MEEQNDIHPLHFAKIPPSDPVKVQRKEFEKQYHLMNRERIRINEELAQQKGDEHQINQKLMWFSHLDKQIEWKMSEIENLERWNLDNVGLSLPIKSIPRTTGFLGLSGKDARSPVRPDRKRCVKRLIKKGRMDIDYLQQVEEEHLSIKKSNGMGTQELDNMIESMVQRIQHGNTKRIDEMKMCRQMNNFKKIKETLISREPDPQTNQLYTREARSKRDKDWKRFAQHKINILLGDIENIKRKQIGRMARVRRLKAELEHVRKNISCLNNKLKNVDSTRIKAYKSAYEFGEQKEEMNSSYNAYQSFDAYVKELARKGDVVELKHVCDMQVEGFMRQWNDNKEFREDYERRMLVLRHNGDI